MLKTLLLFTFALPTVRKATQSLETGRSDGMNSWGNDYLEKSLSDINLFLRQNDSRGTESRVSSTSPQTVNQSALGLANSPYPDWLRAAAELQNSSPRTNGKLNSRTYSDNAVKTSFHFSHPETNILSKDDNKTNFVEQTEGGIVFENNNDMKVEINSRVSTHRTTGIYTSTHNPEIQEDSFFTSWQGIFITSLAAVCVSSFILAGLLTRTRLKYIIWKKPASTGGSDLEGGQDGDEMTENYINCNGKVMQDGRPSLTSDELSNYDTTDDDVFESSDQERRSSGDSLDGSAAGNSALQLQQTAASVSQQRRESGGKLSRALSSITEHHDEDV